MLSLAKVKKVARVTYEQDKSFTIHLPNQRIVFEKQNNLFIAYMSAWQTKERSRNVEKTFLSIANNTQQAKKWYAKDQFERAGAPLELMKNQGYPSVKKAITLVKSGQITDF